MRESETLLDARDIWAGGEAEIYVAGAGDVQRFSSETRQFESTGISGGSVWGTTQNAVLVLDGTVVHHYDGAAWASRDLPFSGVAITGTGDRVFVLGSNGGLGELENGSWVAREGQLDVGLKALCATSDRVYAVAGDDGAQRTGPGVIASYDGTSWARVQEAEQDALLAIACNSSGNVYAVGATRDAGGTAHAVVWEDEAGNWVRHELADVEVFLWDAACVTGGCFAVGTNNTVLALEDL